MRRIIAVLITLLLALMAAPVFAAPGSPTPLRAGEFSSREAVLAWINGYRLKRDFAHVSDAMHALSTLGVFRDPENAGAFVGFLAGVLAVNPEKADDLIGKLLPLPENDQWVIVQAIAYSGLADWKALLAKFAPRMPTRRLMIHKYLAGQLPTLDQAGFEKSPGAFAKLRDVFTFGDKPADKKVVLVPTPMLLDVLWGYYFATGAYSPAISRIIALVSWSKDRDDVDRLTLGGMAKYTLAANAAHDAKLLGMLKGVAKHYPKEMKASLDEVIEAAETVDIARLRREANAAIDELKRKGPGYKRDVSFWGQVGEGALALGCIGAAAVGQVEFGIPCVVGGALGSAGLRMWDAQK
jgi:hypothetical protein